MCRGLTSTISICAIVPSKGAYAGSKASPMGPCPHTECPSHPYCELAGAEFDSEYRIAEIIGDPPHDCSMLDRDLTLVELEAPENS